MNDDQLREIASRHAREAVAPIGSRGHEALQAANGLTSVILQNIRRQEEIIFYALKEAHQPHKSDSATEHHCIWRTQYEELAAEIEKAVHKPGTDWPDVYDHCGKCGEIVAKEDAASHKCTSEDSKNG